MTKEERAEISRKNGAKSKGPTTPTGKAKSSRNAITHGAYATTLKLLVPPHSELLIYEDRREFYNLFDTNIAKYQPEDDHEKAIVREITGLQWSNLRARTAIHALINRDILQTGADVQPLIEETLPLDQVLAAYAHLATDPALRNFHKEYAANTRLILTLERRLHLVQRRWPARNPKPATTTDERKEYGETNLNPEPTQPVETKQEPSGKKVKIINVEYPLTQEKIRLYKRIYPNHDLQFNIYEAQPKAA